MFKLLSARVKKTDIYAFLRNIYVDIAEYHGSKEMVDSADLLVGFEFEFTGNATHPLPAYYLRDIAHAEHDGSVAVEYPTEPIPVENIPEIKRLFYRVNAIITTPVSGYREIQIGKNAGTHMHLSVTSYDATRVIHFDDNERSNLVFIYLITLQEKMTEWNYWQLFGRSYTHYAQKIARDDSIENFTTIPYLAGFSRYNWVNFRNKKTIEYRLPKFRNPYQYYWCFKGCLAIHSDIMRILTAKTQYEASTVKRMAKKTDLLLQKYKKIVTRRG